MYGRRKMSAYLRRQGYRVAPCTVDRLMRDEGLSGVIRGRRHRTTIPVKDARRAPDLLDRDFTASAPNRKWVTDFTDPNVVGIRLRRVRRGLLLAGDRGLARRDRQGHRHGDHGAEDSVVAARSR